MLLFDEGNQGVLKRWSSGTNLKLKNVCHAKFQLNASLPSGQEMTGAFSGNSGKKCFNLNRLRTFYLLFSSIYGNRGPSSSSIYGNRGPASSSIYGNRGPSSSIYGNRLRTFYLLFMRELPKFKRFCFQRFFGDLRVLQVVRLETSEKHVLQVVRNWWMVRMQLPNLHLNSFEAILSVWWRHILLRRKDAFVWRESRCFEKDSPLLAIWNWKTFMQSFNWMFQLPSGQEMAGAFSGNRSIKRSTHWGLSTLYGNRGTFSSIYGNRGRPSSIYGNSSWELSTFYGNRGPFSSIYGNRGRPSSIYGNRLRTFYLLFMRELQRFCFQRWGSGTRVLQVSHPSSWRLFHDDGWKAAWGLHFRLSLNQSCHCNLLHLLGKTLMLHFDAPVCVCGVCEYVACVMCECVVCEGESMSLCKCWSELTSNCSPVFLALWPVNECNICQY